MVTSNTLCINVFTRKAIACEKSVFKKYTLSSISKKTYTKLKNKTLYLLIILGSDS